MAGAGPGCSEPSEDWPPHDCLPWERGDSLRKDFYSVDWPKEKVFAEQDAQHWDVAGVELGCWEQSEDWPPHDCLPWERGDWLLKDFYSVDWPKGKVFAEQDSQHWDVAGVELGCWVQSEDWRPRDCLPWERGDWLRKDFYSVDWPKEKVFAEPDAQHWDVAGVGLGCWEPSADWLPHDCLPWGQDDWLRKVYCSGD